jgi:hypothetical protein
MATASLTTPRSPAAVIAQPSAPQFSAAHGEYQQPTIVRLNQHKALAAGDRDTPNPHQPFCHRLADHLERLGR